MIERLVEHGLPTHKRPVTRLSASGMPSMVTITAIDAERAYVRKASQRLRSLGKARGFQLAGDFHFSLHDRNLQLTIDLEAIDLAALRAREKGHRTWDVLIAQDFLDIVNADAALEAISSLGEPGSLLYFPLTFDGGTSFQPDIDPAFDSHIEELYHGTMDDRVVDAESSGDSRAGRHLLWKLPRLGAEIINAGSSDLVIFPHLGGYSADRRFLLHFIVNTIWQSLHAHPAVDAPRFERWIAERRAQIERGELAYIAHRLDVLARSGDRLELAPENPCFSLQSATKMPDN